MFLMRLAPILLFAYARIEHLRKTLDSLARNPLASESDLTVYMDGAKGEVDLPQVNAARVFLKQGRYEGVFHSLRIIERDKNLGLAQSIIQGVSESLTATPDSAVIVLEDDLLLAPHFLTYMNEGLRLYRDDPRVMCIHGYNYPMETEGLSESFFLLGADCWGWATWGRAWKHFNSDGQALLTALKRRELTSHFDLEGAYPYMQMLEDQILGKNNSWAIRWRAATFLAGGLTLYPRNSLVRNIGIDGSGVHCRSSSDFDVDLYPEKILLKRIPLQEDARAFAHTQKYFSKITGQSFRSQDSLVIKGMRRLKRFFAQV